MLAKVTEQRGSSGVSEASAAKFDEIEQKLDSLQKDVAKLVGYLSNPPKASLAPATQQYPTVKPAPAESPATVQGMPSATFEL
jgi:hypothetical protein